MDSKDLAELAAEASDDRKARNIQLINVSNVTTLTDWIVISEGQSDVQVRAIVTSIEDRLEETANRVPIRKEGFNKGKWALLDYGELIIHVLQPKEREYYALEEFWSNGERKNFSTSE